MNIKIKKISKWLTFFILPVFIVGCGDLLETAPLDEVSSATFWETEEHANQALTGVYSQNLGWEGAQGVLLHSASDNGYQKSFAQNTLLGSSELTPNASESAGRWNSAYSLITACNIFVENITSVDMNENEKSEMIAEARTLRADAYFWLSQFFGGVPLVTDVLTIEEANSVPRDPKNEVVDFVVQELTEAANDLPESRPTNEWGRITKGAALAIKGRLLLAEKSWSEAANTYESIISSGVYSIYPEYKALFVDGEAQNSIEIIFTERYMNQERSHGIQNSDKPSQYGGGFARQKVTQALVDSYLMKDGKPKEESSLYDPENPFTNRDPRLYDSIFLPGYTLFRGKVYQAHPDSTQNDDTVPSKGSNGYHPKKYIDENYEGDPFEYGSDIPIIRYPEVLLSYLEAKIEAGDNITQNLLDQTINKVRARPSVDMPPVTETNPEELRDIVRRERRTELALEGLRLWDLLRWEIAMEKMNGPVLGMKLTNDPDNYEGGLTINEEGHYIVFENNFVEKNKLWPIPQSERDVNSNLEQNPGY